MRVCAAAAYHPTFWVSVQPCLRSHVVAVDHLSRLPRLRSAPFRGSAESVCWVNSEPEQPHFLAEQSDPAGELRLRNGTSKIHRLFIIAPPDRVAPRAATDFSAAQDFAKTSEELAHAPLAQAVFEVPGTTRVYLGADFVSVTKDDTIMGWKALKLSITKRLHLFFDQTVPTVTGQLRPPEENIEFDCSLEASDFLKELIDTRIRPAVQVCVSESTSTVHALVAPRLPLVARCVQTALTLFHYLHMSLHLSTYRPHGMQADGGDVLFLNFDEQTGTVWVKLVGSCVNCPSSEDTLQGNVRNVLSHYAPEVTEVIQVMDEETAITVGKDGREIDRGETPEDKNARFLEHLEAVSGALSSVESMHCR